MTAGVKTATAKKAKATEKPPVSAATENSDNETSPINPGKANFVRRKEMVERIAASSGAKPNVIKTVLDSVLKEIGDALSNGESLNLNPLGKVTVNRRKDGPNGDILICKIRRNTAAKAEPALQSEAAE